MHLSHAGQATVTTRQYARRAVLYALLLTLGGLFLFLYLIKGEGSVVFLLPTVVVVVFLVFLACGFKMSYESLRPRVPKKAPAKVATARVADNVVQTLTTPPVPVPVSDRVARALVKLFRHYGGGLRGVSDDDLVRFALARLEGESNIMIMGSTIGHYAPILGTLAKVLLLLPAQLQTQGFEQSVISALRRKTFRIDLVKIFDEISTNDQTFLDPIPLFRVAFMLDPIQRFSFLIPALCAISKVGAKDNTIHLEIEIVNATSFEKIDENKKTTLQKLFINSYIKWLKLKQETDWNNLIEKIKPKFEESLKDFKERNLKRFPLSKTTSAALDDVLVVLGKIDASTFTFELNSSQLVQAIEESEGKGKKQKTVINFTPGLESINKIAGDFEEYFGESKRKLDSSSLPGFPYMGTTEGLDGISSFLTNGQTINDAIQRVKNTFEERVISELAAIFLAMVTYLHLIYRTNKSIEIKNANLFPLKISPFILTQDLKKVYGKEIVNVADYAYEIITPSTKQSGLLTREYLEIFGRKILDEGELSQRLTEFIDKLKKYAKANPPPSKSFPTEIVVGGVFFDQKKIIYLRMETTFADQMRTYLDHWVKGEEGAAEILIKKIIKQLKDGIPAEESELTKEEEGFEGETAE